MSAYPDLDMTSDVSDIDTSANETLDSVGIHGNEAESTLENDDLRSETKTPTAEPPESNLGRLSMSQPVLATRKPSKLPTKHASTSGLSFIPANPRSVPLKATYEENNRLKEEVFTLQSKLHSAVYKERELRQQLPRQVNEIMDEFYDLQRERLEYDDYKTILAEMEGKLTRATEDAEREKKEREQLRREYERARGEIEKQNVRISELERELSSRPAESDGMDNFTFSSESPNDAVADALRDQLIDARRETTVQMRLVEDLQAELAEVKQKMTEMEEKSAAAQSFAIGHGQTEMNLIGRVDQLEAELGTQHEKEKRLRTVIHGYLNRVLKLERELAAFNPHSSLLNGTNTSQNLTFDVKDGEQLVKKAGALGEDLNSMRKENLYLRKKCAEVTGAVVDLSMSCENEQIQSELNKIVEVANSLQNSQQEGPAVEQDELNETDMVNGVEQLCRDLAARMDISMEGGNESAKEATTHQDEMVKSGGPAAKGDSFAMAPDALNCTGGDAFAQFGRMSMANGTFDISQLNHSISGFLQRSLDTSHQMINVKTKLSSLRTVLSMMFYRLQGSAALFEEVLQYLSDSESEECMEIARRIRAMQLKWSKTTQEADDVNEAVDVAERSVAELQTQLSLLDQSLQDTSFVFDLSRRMTMAHGTAMLDQSVHARLSVAPQVDASHQHTQSAQSGETTVPLDRGLHAEIELLHKAQEEKNAHIEKLNTQISQLIVEGANAKSARDTALSNVEVLRRRLSEVELAASQLKIDFGELNSQCDVEKQQRMEAEEKLKDAILQQNHLSDLLARSEDEHRVVHAEFLAAQETERQLRANLHRLESEKEDLEKDRVSYEKSIEMLVKEKDGLKAVYAEMEHELAEHKSRLSELSSECERAVLECELREQKQKDVEQRAALVQQQMREEMEAVRENANTHAKRVVELEGLVEEYEKAQEDRNGRRNTGPQMMDISLVARSTMFGARSSQTLLNGGDIAEKDATIGRLAGDLESMKGVYSRLAQSIDTLLKIDSDRFEGDMEVEIGQGNVDSIVHGCARLEKVLQKAAQHRVEMVEKLTKHNDELEKRMNVPEVAFTPQKTETDPLRYKVQLRQDFYELTSMAIDLCANMKAVAKISPVPQLPLLIDSARELRNNLNEHFLALKQNDENGQDENLTLDDLIVKWKLSQRQNLKLHATLTDLHAKYEQLQKQCVAHNPQLTGRIVRELENIAKVMSMAKTSAKTLVDQKQAQTAKK